MQKPISVIMAFYNSEDYLKQAIKSILNQTFRDFEFIIINDGSTDKSLKIINSFQDSSIKLINNAANLGLTKSLNIALKSAKGKYIARMDADDISLPERLEKQYNFLETHHDISLIGSFVEVIDSNSRVMGKRELIQDTDLIKFRMLFSNQFIHSSIFFRKQIIDQVGGYNEKYKYSQDFEFLSRMNRTYKMTNFPEYLLKLRVHDRRISHQKIEAQKEFATDVIQKNVSPYLDISNDEASLINKSYYGYIHNTQELAQVKKLYKNILDSYLEKSNLTSEAKERIIQEYDKLLSRINEVNQNKPLFSKLARKIIDMTKH